MPNTTYRLLDVVSVQVPITTGLSVEKALLCQNADTNKSISVQQLPETIGSAIMPHRDIGDEETNHTVTGPALIGNYVVSGPSATEIPYIGTSKFLYDMCSLNANLEYWDVPTLALHLLSYSPGIDYDINQAIKSIKLSLSNNGGINATIAYAGAAINIAPEQQRMTPNNLARVPFREANYFDFQVGFTILGLENVIPSIAFGMVSDLDITYTFDFLNPDYAGKPPNMQYIFNGATVTWSVKLAYDWAVLQSSSLANILKAVSTQYDTISGNEISNISLSQTLIDWHVKTSYPSTSFSQRLQQVFSSLNRTPSFPGMYHGIGDNRIDGLDGGSNFKVNGFETSANLQMAFPISYITLSGEKVMSWLPT